MARSYGALKVEVWEVGSDFRKLTPLAQWGYVMLMSQPQLNNLGVLPYAPEKWCRLAAGMTREQLDAVIGDLERDRYIVVDRDTDELLIRTFVTHDKIWAQPKLVTNARKLIREVESLAVRQALVDRHPWLLDNTEPAEIRTLESLWKERGNETPSETPSDTPIPTRARAGSGSGSGSRGSSGPSTSAAVSHGDDAAAAIELLTPLLDQLAIPKSLRSKALADPDRALAVARYTLANNAGGAYFRTVWDSGDTPATNGNGAPAQVDLEQRARDLYERTGDSEAVADWLAGQHRLSVAERERIEHDVCATTDDEPDLGLATHHKKR